MFIAARRYFTLLVLGCAAAAAPVGLVCAQDILRIAAVVNDDVISAQDLEQRIDLAIVATGQPNSPDLRKRLRDQVLRSLIDERLQLQEAARLKIAVEPNEINEAIGRIEKQNNMPEGKLDEVLREQGVNASTLRQQVRAEIAWSKAIRRRVVPGIVITDEEVDLAIQQIKRDVGSTESLLAEILLLVDTPDQEEEVRRNAQRISEQIRAGANFPAMARQFSQGTTAAAGGDLGWVRPGTLLDEVEKAVAGLQPGVVSAPIRSAAGYHVMLVREKRQVRLGDPADAVVRLKELSFRIPANATRADADATLSIARAVYDSVSGCSDLEKVAGEMELKPPADLGRTRVAELPPRLQPAAANLPLGKLSPPVPQDGGISMYMVCERVEASGEPDREQVRTRLGNARIEQGARRLLRDLRRDSVVEFR